jgi:hypothetical protein
LIEEAARAIPLCPRGRFTLVLLFLKLASFALFFVGLLIGLLGEVGVFTCSFSSIIIDRDASMSNDLDPSMASI